MHRVEDGQVEELRRWAEGLAEDERPELRAAAKAILLLAKDVEAARSQLLEERMIRQALEEQAALAAEAERTPADDLFGRLRSLLRLRPRSD